MLFTKNFQNFRHTYGVDDDEEEDSWSARLTTNVTENGIEWKTKEFGVKHLIINDQAKFNLIKKKKLKFNVKIYNSFKILNKLFSKNEIDYTMVSVSVQYKNEEFLRKKIIFMYRYWNKEKERIIFYWNFLNETKIGLYEYI